MKAMTKQQISAYAGVSVKTLVKWCRPFRHELEQMGLTPSMKLLPPHIVKHITERLCIDVPE